MQGGDTITYKVKKGKETYYYDVTYNEEALSNIFKELQNYNYERLCHDTISEDITKFPATKKNVLRRVKSYFNSSKKYSNATLYPETINHVKEKKKDYVTFEYSYDKDVDLYKYLDMILNNRPIMKYKDLFGRVNMFYALIHSDQIMLDSLFNYINSDELMDNQNNKTVDYDYIGLNELYKKTLECFNFNLIAIKEYVETEEVLDGLSLQRKKY